MSVHHSKDAEEGRPAQIAASKKPEEPIDVLELIACLTPPAGSGAAAAPNGTASAAGAAAAAPTLSAAAEPGSNPMSSVGLSAAPAPAPAPAPVGTASPGAISSAAGDAKDQKVIPPDWDAKWIDIAFKAAEKIAAHARVEKGRVQLTTSMGATGDELLRSLVGILSVDGFGPRSKAAALQGQCARALGNLCMQDDNRLKVLKFGGVRALLNRVKTSCDVRFTSPVHSFTASVIHSY